MKKVFLLIALAAVCFCQVNAQNIAKIDISLQQEMTLRQASDLIRINVIMNQQYDQMEMRTKTSIFPKKEARRTFVVNELKRFSEETQQDVMYLLSTLPAVTEVQSFWIANFINCYANIEAIEELSLHPDVLLIGFDKEEKLIPDNEIPVEAEPSKEIAYNVSKVNAPQVWALGYKGDNVIVAVLDTGVNYNHVDLKDHMWEHPDYPYYGWNFISNNNNPKDDNSHGSHCAGTVAGNGTAGSQTGIAPNATIMAVKVLDGGGSGTLSSSVNGIQFAVEKGADVLSMSWGWAGGGGSSERIPMRNALINTMEAGVIAAVSAGNEGGNQGQYPIPNNVGCPGNCPPPWLHPDQTITGGTSAVVCVGATNSSDNIAWFSSRGPVTWQSTSGFNDYPYPSGIGLLRPDVCAPGVNIKSCRHNNNTGYTTMDGTSMAAPCVAGAMALLLSKNPSLIPAEICEVLETTAVHLPNSSSPKNNNYGSGRIDVFAAITAIPEYIEDIVFEGIIINDETGNNNGRINPGETVGLTITLKNVSEEPVNNVQLIFKTTDEYVTIINDEADFGDFAANETKTVEDAFTIAISENAPAGHQIAYTLEAKFNGTTKRTYLKFIVYDYILEVTSTKILNANGEITPGETADVGIYLQNTGNEIASNLTAKLTTSSQYLTINQSTSYYGQLYPEQYKQRTFNVTLSPDTPASPPYVTVILTITDETGRKTTESIILRFKNVGQPPQSCNPVEDLEVKTVDNDFVLTWTAPAGNPTKYLVYCNNVFMAETTTTTYTHPFSGGGNYLFCVEALYSNGCSCDVSETVSLPCSEVELTGEAISETEVYLSWLPELENMKYVIYRDAEFLDEVTDNFYTDTNLTLGKTYCYTVTAICTGEVESEPSNEVCLDIVSINELQNDIKIYPNPTSGELIISMDNEQWTIDNVTIYDIMGKTVNNYQLSIVNSQLKLDVSHLPAGMYYLRIADKTVKFVKE